MSNNQYERQLIGEIWTTDEPYRTLAELCDGFGSRWAGSENEHRAAEFLRDKLSGFGLENVHLEPVTFGAWERGEAALRMTAPTEKQFSCIALPYCPPGEVEAELIDVGNGEQEDFERLGEAVRGKIVVSAAETNAAGTPGKQLSHRTDKLRFAVDAGAVGVVFVNQNPGLLHITGGIAGPGGTPAEIIAVGTSWEHGQAILRLAQRHGGGRLKITTGGRFFENVSYNVVAEIRGSRWPNEIVMAGAHYDGHDISQAALDDGAGTAVCLEAARVLAALPREAIGRTLRFVLFCGEEVGLFGSWADAAVVEPTADRIRFMLNLDGAGRGKGGSESLTLAGRPELLSYFVEQSQAMNYKYTITDLLNAHSDHFPYAIRGIPAATLSSPDDSATLVGRGWGHTEADTFDKATLRGLQMAAMTTARVLLGVAGDEKFPGSRLDRETLRKQLEDLGLDIALKRAGRWELVGGSLAAEPAE